MEPIKITEIMIKTRAKQLAVKYEDNEHLWAKYINLASIQLHQELDSK